ncbi:hypothetical protein LguiA_015210 [Lonicera macranthoides]
MAELDSEKSGVESLQLTYTRGAVIKVVVQVPRVRFNLLSDLTTERDDWIIQARLTRKWESINLKADNELSPPCKGWVKVNTDPSVVLSKGLG